MAVTETTSTSWISRLGGSIKGVFFGIIMIIGGCALLWWNEGNVVKTRDSLNEAQGQLIQLPNADEVNPDNENKLVYVAGMAIGQELEDPMFGIAVEGIKLSREVEMYQWVEKSDTKKKKKLGGGEEETTTYTYKKEWSSSLVNSANFKEQAGHENPAALPLDEASLRADEVTLGAFNLSQSLMNSIGGSQKMPIANLDSMQMQTYTLSNGVAYGGSKNMSSPQIGDYRVSYEYIPNKDISIVSKQFGDSFTPFVAENGYTVEILNSGIVPAEQMFQGEQTKATWKMWLWRVLGYLLVSGGFGAFLKPLEVISDIVPFIGNIVGFANGLLSSILGGIISMIVIGLAWVVYRPLLGISLLALAAGLIYLIVSWNKKRKAKKKAA